MIRAAGAWALALAAVVSARSAHAHDPVTTKVTFAREVRGILAARCVTCHAPGGSAPMPLTTFEEVLPWARALKQQILTRQMPKWHAARGFGAFRNDPSLTPFEQALLVSWIDGGAPEGSPRGSRVPRRRDVLTPAPGSVVTVTIPPRGDVGRTLLAAPAWITGWSFEPGDPLITAAVISIDAATAGAWVAGDQTTLLPSGTGFSAMRRIRVDVRRRGATDYERLFVPRRSVLTLQTADAAPPRRVWTEQVQCGSQRAGPGADLLAVRPLLDRAEARLWVSRAGAPSVIVGWFRDFDPLYPRTYWLQQPAEMGVDARLVADGPCRVELTLTGQQQPAPATERR